MDPTHYIAEAKYYFWRSIYLATRVAYYYFEEKFFNIKNRITGIQAKLDKLEQYESSRTIFSELVRRVEDYGTIPTASKLNAMKDMIRELKSHQLYKIDGAREFIEVMEDRVVRLK